MPATKPNRYLWTFVVLMLLAAALPLAAEEAKAPRRPRNVVLITVDSLRPDFLAAYGGKGTKTPNLDSLAGEGVRFEKVTACTPLSMPSHSTIMTGTWPTTHGVRSDGNHQLKQESTTLAEEFKDQGYMTSGIVGSHVLRKIYGVPQGITYLDDRMPKSDAGGRAKTRSGRLVGALALEHLSRLQSSAFFMWVHFSDPQAPYLSSKGHAPDSEMAYREEIELVDQQVGRLMSALKKGPAARKTLVILVGSHGEGLGAHGEAGHGYLINEPMVRVPMLMWAPDFMPAKKVVGEQVRTVDLMPTVLDYVGYPIPETVQGASMRALIEGPGELARRIGYSETWAGHDALGLSVLRAATLEGFKYVDSPEPALYNLAEDPGETKNIIVLEEVRAERLRRALKAMIGDEAKVAALGGSGPHPAAHVEEIEAYMRALKSIDAGDLRAAEVDLRKVLDVLPEAVGALASYAKLLSRTGRDDQVVPFVSELLKANPDAIGIRLFLARTLVQQRRAGDSISHFKQAVAAQPGDAGLQLELGNVLVLSGDLKAARAALVTAANLDATQAAPELALAGLCIKEKKYAEAREHVQTAARLQGESHMVQQQVARLLNRLDKLEAEQ